MLQHLSVKNYALIDELELDLSNGFSVITGETGAGKSIILGALSLILGKRADLRSLRSGDQKCIVEGTFRLSEGSLKGFFEEEDLDFEEQTIIRREISPSGKSRAFVNDTPVNLNVLEALTIRLIDVHSQHQNLLLNDTAFQLNLLDNFAANRDQQNEYLKSFQDYQQLRSEYDGLRQKADSEAGDVDYLKFLFEELTAARLEPEEQEDIEKELEILENSGEIKARLSESLDLLDGNHSSALGALQKISAALTSISQYDEDLESIVGRVDSARIELDDIRVELEQKNTDSEFDPNRAEELDNRLSLLLSLQKKHNVENVEELIRKRGDLEERINTLANIEEKLDELENRLREAENTMAAKAKDLHDSRRGVITGLQESIHLLLKELNMTSAHFVIELTSTRNFTERGNDKVEFLFAANKGQQPERLSKVASGGELSRVMLALKAIMARTKDLPAIIFDEIDTGVSGETAGKIGEILKDMGKVMQVIAISHLPQIASMGKEHFKVMKESDDKTTHTRICKLEGEERINELARLLSGEKISSAALQNAREMLITK